MYWYWYLFVECLTWPVQRSGSEPGPQVERQTNADFSTTFRFGRPSVCLCGVSKTSLIAAVSPPVVPFCKLKAKTSDPKTLRPTPSTAYYDSATYLAKPCWQRDWHREEIYCNSIAVTLIVKHTTNWSWAFARTRPRPEDNNTHVLLALYITPHLVVSSSVFDLLSFIACFVRRYFANFAFVKVFQ